MDTLFDYDEKPTTCPHCGRRLVDEKCPWCDAPRVVIKDEPRKRHRAKDEGASKAGAYDVIGRATSAKVKLLRAYSTYGASGCVSSDACLAAGLSLASGYRARVSELREQELIRTLTDAHGNVLMAEGALGSSQSIDAITDKGWAALRTVDASASPSGNNSRVAPGSTTKESHVRQPDPHRSPAVPAVTESDIRDCPECGSAPGFHTFFCPNRVV